MKEEISKWMIAGCLASPVGCWNTAGHSCSLVPVEGRAKSTHGQLVSDRVWWPG